MKCDEDQECNAEWQSIRVISIGAIYDINNDAVDESMPKGIVVKGGKLNFMNMVTKLKF